LAQVENQGISLAMAASLVESAVGGSTAAAAAAAAAPAAVRLEDFIGKWRDSIGHQVSVTWARKGQSSGELDVQLRRPHAGSRPIHLNVKALGQSQFQCGHFELKLDESSTEKIVWGNTRNSGKDSVWQRDEHSDRARSRSRSSSQRRRNCGCVMMGKVALRCVDHPPLLPPRSVLHDISTPGAWAPPAKEPEIAENRSETEQVSLPPATWEGSCPPAKATEVSARKPADADALLEAYDERLAKADAAAAELTQPDTSQASPDVPFGEAFLAKGKLLVEHFQVQAAAEADTLFAPKNWHSAIANKGLPQDPRLRGRVASTGGA